jgi:hypothetical protein
MDFVVVLLVRIEQMVKILLTEDDVVIKAVSPDRSDQLLVLIENSNSDTSVM